MKTARPPSIKLPKSWEEAKTDGERWRFCLMQAAELSPSLASRATYMFADFLHGQFGVQTMAQDMFRGFGRMAEAGVESDDDTRKHETGAFAVSSLSEDETIARLASGIKRFKLPFEFNYIRILQTLGDKDRTTYGEQALDTLAQIFENRQQYDRAAEYWKKAIAAFGPGQNNVRNLRLQQIVGSWGNFDFTKTQPAGTDPIAYLVFRNAKHVKLTAHQINMPKLLEDVKGYIKTLPPQVDYQRANIDNLGYRLVDQNQQEYIVKQSAQWEMDLKPRDKHFDKRVKIDVPVKDAGAYLITAQMDGGNTTRVIIWHADTIIVTKNLDGGSYYFVADAATGAPLAKANLAFFGYQQVYEGQPGKVKINVKEFADNTDAYGQTIVKSSGIESFSWLTTATTGDGRFAYYGFSNLFSGRVFDPQYNQKKVYVITDRPVYRPGQTVKYKFWLGTAKYDQEGNSEFADQPFDVLIHDPRGQQAQERTYKSDSFGGFDGEFTLPADAMLGVYGLGIINFGGSNFRVEEYKKPEYEVTIDAPTEPVMLGDKISATIVSKYYFGSPVVNAKVHYKVTREAHTAQWYPKRTWDWFYEPGYWWFAADYQWFPGWDRWGMRRPHPMWFVNRFQQPELVAENDAMIGPDGKVKVEIDTAIAKAVHGDEDHKYTITAEVTDESRRVITGSGDVLVARKPFKVYAWVDRGYYATGDVIAASFNAQTLDQKPIAKAKGAMKLLKISYGADGKPFEQPVQTWDLATDAQGESKQQIKAVQPGQYRLSYTVTDEKNHSIEGGYIFVVRGEGFDGKQFRFNDLELTADKAEYQPGDKAKLMLNTDLANSTVLLFARPSNGVYLPPKVVRLNGKSAVEELEIIKRDMPNIFVEALTVSGGNVFDETRELVVPPENRIVNVSVVPSAQKYLPGEKAKVKLRLTSANGEPIEGSTVVSIYDKSAEYISGGSNVPEIKSFFWKWRRAHNPLTQSSAFRGSGPIARNGETTMGFLGVFGQMVADQSGAEAGDVALADGAPGPLGGFGGAHGMRGMALRKGGAMEAGAAMAPASPMAAAPHVVMGFEDADRAEKREAAKEPGQGPGALDGENVQPTVRQNFADTALWVGHLNTGKDGLAEVELTMPENLTTWKARVWSMSQGSRVGEGTVDVVTFKNLIVRLQSPRFFVQKDEVVLSANVHNYLADSKHVTVTLDLSGGPLAFFDNAAAKQEIDLPANGEKRVDWRVKVIAPGQATVKVAALTDKESDAMQQTFTAYVHGMLKTDSFAGAMRPGDVGASLTFNVPQERLPEQSRVEVRYSPSVASAMVDALPYLVDYPYGCTEQTLNRFLPTVITQKILIGMHLDLKDIEKKQTNLNAQEIGDDKVRAADWKRNNPPDPGEAQRNPVFDIERVNAMSKDGVNRLTNMQLNDGGWGWFSGFGEQSYPHTTALVVHGLQIAKENDVALVPGMLERGINWLRNYQMMQIQMIRNAPAQIQPWKPSADNLDAYVYMVLADAGAADKEMMEYLYRDRNNIAVYAKAMFGLALLKQNEKPKLDMILHNISQYVVQDDENQTAYLQLPADNAWWAWYGSETEAMGYTLKLLSRTDAKGAVAPRLAKYMINNRKHGSYWDSTRDTAVCIEALADYIKASGEDKPDETITVALDGKQVKQVHIDATNLFSFDNKFILAGPGVTAGEHKLTFAKAGNGPLYFNAYVTNFTLEDPIKKSGLEIRVQRKIYKLTQVDAKVKAAGTRGQALDEKIEKYERSELPDSAMLKSGDMVEVELEIDSKNDYEYILLEDMKASGFEPVELQSGYNGNDLNAYMELHDERVAFFCRTLARGKHSVSYRLRAEIPGKFSVLPTKASAMYAPELKANSDEMKVGIND